MKNLKRNLILLTALIFLSLSFSNSQVIKYEFEISAKYTMQAAALDLNFMLIENQNQGYDKFELYIRPGTLQNTIENLTQFKTKIDITNDLNDTLVRSSNNVTYRQYIGRIKYEMQEKSEVLLIVATGKNGTMIVSIPRQINKEIVNQNSIYFSSEPKKDNLIGLNSYFRYEAKAKTNSSNDIIRYKILHRTANSNYKWSADATIKAETGLFEFKGTEAGFYMFSIEASSETGSGLIKTVQNILIQVDECEALPTLTVTLTDQNGNPVKEESVFLVSLENAGSESKVFTAITNKNGMATIQTTRGKYNLVYNSRNNFGMQQYYNSKPGTKDPEVIEITECGYQYSVKFNVRTNLDSNNVFDLVFTKIPKAERLQLDHKYEFQAKAEHRKEPNAIIEYLLEKAPEGMKVDSKTGLITWTPNKSGVYTVNLTARLANDHYISTNAQITFEVSNCAMRASVILSLFDKAGNPITPNNSIFAKSIANLYFYQNIGNNNDTLHRDYYKLMIASSTMIQGNKAYFVVDEGQYLLMISSQHQNIWYKNANDVQDATPIKVQCNDTLMLDMVLDLEQDVEKKTIISGYCLDESGKVVLSEIVFEGLKGNSNGMNEQFRKIVTNNENGYYSVEVPNGFTYVAYAISKNTNRPLYWKNTYNRMDATPIYAEREKYEDINFVFKTEDNHTQKVLVKGTVTSTANILVKDCFVVVLDADVTTKPKNNTGTTYLSTDGNFEFNLEAGSFIFLAIPQSKDFIPGFYNEFGIAEFTWEDASIVNVNANSHNSINIIIQEIDRKPGIARVNGSIKVKNSNQKIENANILLLSSNKAVEYTLSNYNGEFDISNIADGDYTLVVNKVGYSKYETNLTLDAQEPINLDIALETEMVSSVEDFDVKFINLEVYPNPSSDYIELKNNTTMQYNKYEIYSLKGNVLSSGSYEGQQIDVSNLTAGKYFIKLLKANESSVVPFTITK